VSAGVLAGIVAVVVVAAVVTTLAGFGFSLMAVPLLAALVGPRDAVAVASLLSLVSSAALLARLRRRVVWSVAGRQLAGAVVAMPFGLLVLLRVDERVLLGGIAVAVSLAALALARGLRLEHEGPGADLGAGLLSGLLNTSVGTSGPPLVFVNQARGLSPDCFRATLSAVFTGSALVGGTLFASAGRYTPAVLAAAGLCLPAVGVGWVVGLRLHRRVDAERMRALVLVLLFTSAAVAGVSALT
jgi:uncharacterized membrane protein YfcA